MSNSQPGEFSFRSRFSAIQRLRDETFDLLVVGGGITGAAVARDAASRGLKVALVEKRDFAWGTSSRSSKLIHGGLRYLENFEFHLVFEALAERAFLLKSAPHMVRPLPFYLPVYEGDSHGRALLGAGLWFYDLLALLRTPGFHRSMGRDSLLKEIPLLRSEGLKGGFRYFDASMSDDGLVMETLRAAHVSGAVIGNYLEAVTPLWESTRIGGFRVRDVLAESPAELEVRAKRVVICAGPWLDQVGASISHRWQNWLSPSKGIHLVFDLKKLPLPGALVMTHPEDGRVSFVIPRPDMGAGVAIVGTTDGPSPGSPEQATVDAQDVQYLLDLLNRYFPELKLIPSDILSAYVGVRPLMGVRASTSGSEGQGRGKPKAELLQKVSREHFIGEGPGGTVLVAGGKYTTHRVMAEEIVDFTLKLWRRQSVEHGSGAIPAYVRRPRTRLPVNPRTVARAVQDARHRAATLGWSVPESLWERYGAEALDVMEIHHAHSSGGGPASQLGDPEGFPLLDAQFRFALRTGMILHLEDFYLRRVPLFLTRADHGLPWAPRLAAIWAEEMGRSRSDADEEVQRLEREIHRRMSWKVALGS